MASTRSNPCAIAPSSRLRFKNTEPEPGPRPPSNSGRVQSTITFDGSKSYFEPRPLHAGHAPYGELKLNERGSSCGTEMPHSLQAIFSEKTCSVPPTTDDGDQALGQLQRRGDGLLEPRRDAGLHQQAVDDDFDGVILALVEARRIVERAKVAVDARAHEAVARQLFQFLAVLAFSARARWARGS